MVGGELHIGETDIPTLMKSIKGWAMEYLTDHKKKPLIGKMKFTEEEIEEAFDHVVESFMAG